MTLDRRAFLAALALGLTGSTAAGCTAGAPPRNLSIAAGEPGGFYLEVAQLLATEINAENPDLHASAVPTSGSQDNLTLLAAGKVDLALMLADSAEAAQPRTPLRAIGRVYENYLQLVVLADSPIRGLPDLAGHSISLGADGSGAELSGRRLLAVAGLRTSTDAPAAPGMVTVSHHPLNQAIADLHSRRIDALLWSGGVPTPALAGLAGQQPIRLLPLGDYIPALRAAYNTTYEPVTVPADAYSPGPEITTIGVANLLLCRPDTDPNLVATVTRILVTRAPNLVPQQALGTQFLDPRSLIATHDIPLHPAAANTYRALHG